jgi:hypothetical protein
MNIRGTKNKLALSKNSVRELNKAEWELVGGGTSLEITYSQNCATNGCSQGCSPSYTCPVSYSCPATYTCNCSGTK